MDNSRNSNNILARGARAVARRWKVAVPAVTVGLLGVAWLAFGYFGVHTAFIDDTVEEALPTFETPAVEAAMPDDAVVVIDDQPAPSNDTDTADTADAQPGDAEVAQAVDDSTPTADDAVVAEPAEADQAAPGEIVTEYAGQFSGTSRYDVSGEAIVLGNGTDQRFLRFENFESNNGPDLNVYLVNPDDPSDFIDLGDLKGNVGDQNYEIPAGIDLERYSQVSIWCVRFSVGFGSADLTPVA